MIQTNHFFNLGYGWLCKHCSAENAERHDDEVGPGRTWDESHDGKTEGQTAGLALARWTDALVNRSRARAAASKNSSARR